MKEVFCRQFYCDRRRDRYCCRACRLQGECRNPCRNHPSRCGLEDRVRSEAPARKEE